ncbi:CHASE2 domain-containing protein [bacterium]|nr:CHASE2 domain-containing protein [bacterium]
MKKNIIISICLGLITSVSVIFLFKIPIFETINNRCLDIMFNLRGDTNIHRDIVLIEIDDKTINALSWPLKKDVYARVVEMLSQARARAIGLDMVFPNIDKKDNSYLASAIANARNISLGFEFKPDQRKDSLSIVKDKNILTAQHVVLPNPSLLAAAHSVGYISILPDMDGIVRRIPLLLKHTPSSIKKGEKDKIFSCLPLQMVIDSLNISSIGFDHNGIMLDKFRIPTNKSYQMLINYNNNGFRRYSLVDIIDPQGDILMDPFYFRNKMILIGSISKKCCEISRTPSGDNIPSLYIHANILNNILTSNFLTTIPEILSNASLLLIGLILGIILSVLPYSNAVIVTFCGCFFYILICFISFKYNGLCLNVLPPVVIAVVLPAIIGLYRYLLSINDVDKLAGKMRLNETKISRLQRENEKISLKLNPSFKIDFRSKEVWYPSTAQNSIKISRDFEHSLRILQCLVHERWGSDRPEIHWIEGFIIYHDSWTKDYPVDPRQAFDTIVTQLNIDLFGKEIGIKKRVIMQTEQGYCSLNGNIRCESNVKSSIRCFKKAYELFQANKLEDAEKELEQAINFDTENIRFLTLLGDVRDKLGKQTEAMEGFVTAYQVLQKEIERIKGALNIFEMREDELLKEIKNEKKRLIWKGIDDEKGKIKERIEKLIGLSDYLAVKLLTGAKIMDDGERLISLLMDSALLLAVKEDIYSSLTERGLSVDNNLFEASWREILYLTIKDDVREINSNVLELKKELKSWLRHRMLERVVSIPLESRCFHELCMLWDMEDRFQNDGLIVTQEEVLKEFGWGARYYHSLKEIEKKLQQIEQVQLV